MKPLTSECADKQHRGSLGVHLNVHATMSMSGWRSTHAPLPCFPLRSPDGAAYTDSPDTTVVHTARLAVQPDGAALKQSTSSKEGG